MQSSLLNFFKRPVYLLPTTLNNGLVHLWSLDADSVDSVGTFDGTDTFVGYSSSYGNVSGGGLFNGSSSKIHVNTPFWSMFGSTTASRSYSAWVKFDNTAGSGSIFRSGRDGEAGLQSQATGSNHYFYFLMKTSTGYKQYYSYTGGVTRNAWHHCVFTLDMVSKEGIMYVDGVESMHPSYPKAFTGVFALAAVDTYIGSNFFGTGEYHKGNIDEVGLWDRVLTPSEVAGLYNRGDGSSHPYPT